MPRPLTPPRPSAARHPVLVVGSVAYDEITVPGGETARSAGGSATYAAIAAAYFAPTRLVGVVGGDFSAEIPRLRRRGIDLAGLQVVREGRTFFWSGIYHDNFTDRTTRATELNVFAGFDPVLPPAYRRSRFVVLGNIQPALQARVLDQLSGRPFVAADTMNLWIDTARAELLRLLPRVDLLVVNEEEARQLSGERQLLAAARRLRALGPRAVLVKLGPNGSMLSHPQGYFALPAYPVEAVRDPTGAGDSFLGALVGCLASEGRSDLPALRRAIACATVTASLTVEALGPARLESAGRREIAARHRRLLRWTQV